MCGEQLSVHMKQGFDGWLPKPKRHTRAPPAALIVFFNEDPRFISLPLLQHHTHSSCHYNDVTCVHLAVEPPNIHILHFFSLSSSTPPPKIQVLETLPQVFSMFNFTVVGFRKCFNSQHQRPRCRLSSLKHSNQCWTFLYILYFKYYLSSQ